MFCVKHLIYTNLLMLFSWVYVCNAKFVKRPLKILVYESYFPPHTSTAVLNQITGLLDRGHEVYVYTKRRGDMQWAHPDIARYSLMERVYFADDKNSGEKNKNKGRGRLRGIRRSNRRGGTYHLRNLPPDLDTFDIIYCPFGYRAVEFLSVIKKKKIKAKFVTGFRGADLSRDIKQNPHKYDELLTIGDLFLPVCDYFKLKLMKLGCPKRKIKVLRSGIDCSFFSYPKKGADATKTIRLVSICRFVEKKGIKYAIRAVATLLKKHNHIEYSIFGSGPLKDDLQALINHHGVQDKTKILHRVSQKQVADLLSDFHIFLLPSTIAKNGDEEGIPNSVKEAMARGVIPISTHHAGNSELIKNSAGFLVTQKNVPALAKKIEYLIQNPGVWEKMRLAGRKIVENEYDKEIINDQLEQIFHQLCSA